MSGGMGDEIIGAPGSFDSLSEWDKMVLVSELDTSRRRREELLAKEVSELTVEAKGEEDA